MGRKAQPIADRFWPKVQSTPADDCWPWAASLDRDGYGRFGKTLAHRVAYELLVRPIPPGFEVDHTCRNRACVNPQHLEAVTKIENGRRSESAPALNARKTRCVRGHLFDEKNTRIEADGGRVCRKCDVIRTTRHRSRKADAA